MPTALASPAVKMLSPWVCSKLRFTGWIVLVFDALHLGLAISGRRSLQSPDHKLRQVLLAARKVVGQALMGPS